MGAFCALVDGQLCQGVLVDFESLLVRANAIRVAGELLSKIPQSMPDEIIELLTIYLEESYVVIHQNAARAIRACRFQQDDRGNKVLNLLLNIENYYRQEAKDFDFLRDAFNALRSSFGDWPGVRRFIASKLLPIYARLPDAYFAEDMLVLLGDQLKNYPDLAKPFVQIALDHLKATARDKYNDDTHRDRGKILERLRDLPAPTLAEETPRFRDLIRSKAGKDQIDVVRVLEILSHKELHAEAATLAEEALALVPDVKSREFERMAYAAIHAAESAESLVFQGRGTDALAIIEATVKRAGGADSGDKP
jgi:hypothetical protein